MTGVATLKMEIEPGTKIAGFPQGTGSPHGGRMIFMSVAQGVAGMILADEELDINIDPDLETGVSLDHETEIAIAGSLHTIRDLGVSQAILAGQITQCDNVSDIDTALRRAMSEMSPLTDVIVRKVYDNHRNTPIEMPTPITAQNGYRMWTGIAFGATRISTAERPTGEFVIPRHDVVLSDRPIMKVARKWDK
jgi:hypothetical protein